MVKIYCVVSLAAGVGSCDLTLSNPGQPDVSVTYAGDDKFNGTSDLFTPGPTYAKADTTTVVISSDNQSVYGQEIDFTATVSVDFSRHRHTYWFDTVLYR